MPDFFYVENMSSPNLRKMAKPPWDTVVPAVPFPTPGVDKDKHRAWGAEPTTKHCYFSPIEPLNPHLRVGRENPPRLAHAFVADFDDSKLVGRSTADLIASIHVAVKKHGASVTPNYISRTHSDKARLVWLFESPVKAGHSAAYKAFLSELVSDLKVDRMLVGGRDATGDNIHQIFDIGHGWEEIHPDPIPKALLNLLAFRGAEKVNFKADSTVCSVPLDVVHAEINNQFPGRWTGDFKERSKGPLVWIDDGIDRDGVSVMADGFYVHSDRYPEQFISWEKVLGKGFTDQYQSVQLDNALANRFYDGKFFWRFDPVSGRSTCQTDQDVRLNLRNAGFAPDRKKKETASQIDGMIDYIKDHNCIEFAGPMVHHAPGLVELEQDSYLNIKRDKVVAPAEDGDPKNWPVLHQFLSNLWDQHLDPVTGWGPNDYFFSWLKRFYLGGLNYTPQQGHGLIIVGDAGQGKSFLGSAVLGGLLGGVEDASSLLSGQTLFNKHLAHSPVWTIDDTSTAQSAAAKRLFGDLLKRHTANPHVEYAPKYHDTKRLPWFGRIVITCNQDAESLDVIPSLDNSITDKLMLFRTSDYRHEFDNHQQNAAMVAKELPHLARWLIDYVVPPELIGTSRYGVMPYHHPFVQRAAAAAHPDSVIADILELWMSSSFADTGSLAWAGSSSELFGELVTMRRTSPLMRGITVQRLGRMLKRLETNTSCPAYKGRTRQIHTFKWQAPNPTEIHA